MPPRYCVTAERVTVNPPNIVEKMLVATAPPPVEATPIVTVVPLNAPVTVVLPLFTKFTMVAAVETATPLV